MTAEPEPEGAEALRLMGRVAARDRAAERDLAQRLAPRVRRLCHVLLRDPTEADDAAQLALLEILKSATTFQAQGRLEGWADTITVRTALRHARRLRARRSFIQPVAQPEHLPSASGDLRQVNTTASQMRHYLSQLPAEKREAFVLRHALGHSVEEIAELTDSPVGTVKDRLVSAKKQLRKLFAREQLLLGPGALGRPR